MLFLVNVLIAEWIYATFLHLVKGLWSCAYKMISLRYLLSTASRLGFFVCDDLTHQRMGICYIKDRKLHCDALTSLFAFFKSSNRIKRRNLKCAFATGGIWRNDFLISATASILSFWNLINIGVISLDALVPSRDSHLMTCVAFHGTMHQMQV